MRDVRPRYAPALDDRLNRAGSSMVAAKPSAVITPTPGTDIRRHTTVFCRAIERTFPSRRRICSARALSALSTTARIVGDACNRRRRSPRHAWQTRRRICRTGCQRCVEHLWSGSQGRNGFVRIGCGWQGAPAPRGSLSILHERSCTSRTNDLRQADGIVAVRLGRHHLQSCISVASAHADDGNATLSQPISKPDRQRTGLKSCTGYGKRLQRLPNRVRTGCHLPFGNNAALVINNADRGRLLADIQPGIILHGGSPHSFDTLAAVNKGQCGEPLPGRLGPERLRYVV
ncbi:hypothetical protein EV128_104326 [Rhizobium azibense]|nr:hypothetical protein EV128_104326 [Rhizobium azibense]